jgi:hypothetical protein
MVFAGAQDFIAGVCDGAGVGSIASMPKNRNDQIKLLRALQDVYSNKIAKLSVADIAYLQSVTPFVHENNQAICSSSSSSSPAPIVHPPVQNQSAHASKLHDDTGDSETNSVGSTGRLFLRQCLQKMTDASLLGKITQYTVGITVCALIIRNRAECLQLSKQCAYALYASALYMKHCYQQCLVLGDAYLHRAVEKTYNYFENSDSGHGDTSEKLGHEESEGDIHA